MYILYPVSVVVGLIFLGLGTLIMPSAGAVEVSLAAFLLVAAGMFAISIGFFGCWGKHEFVSKDWKCLKRKLRFYK